MPETLSLNGLRYTIPISVGGYRTLVSEGEKGKERVRSKRSDRKHGFRLVLDPLSIEEAWDIYEFYDRHDGGAVAFYLWVPDCQLIANRGFEDGAIVSGSWGDAREAVIDDTTPRSGAYCAKTVGSGSGNGRGPLTDDLPVDENALYTVSEYTNVTAHVAGQATFEVAYKDKNKSSLGGQALATYNGITGGYLKTEKTIGPGGDYAFPSGTAYMTAFWYGNNNNMTYFMDDVSIIGKRRFLVRFKSDRLDGEYFFFNRSRLTLDVIEDKQ